MLLDWDLIADLQPQLQLCQMCQADFWLLLRSCKLGGQKGWQKGLFLPRQAAWNSRLLLARSKNDPWGSSKKMEKGSHISTRYHPGFDSTFLDSWPIIILTPFLSDKLFVFFCLGQPDALGPLIASGNITAASVVVVFVTHARLRNACDLYHSWGSCSHVDIARWGSRVHS